jgi:GR25 family glycosyltransferase involved in LPS biosynthesis
MTDAKPERGFGNVELLQREASDSDVALMPMSRIAAPPPLIFLHSSFRTSSTWFWNKFRPFRETVCYYEPFNDDLGTITTEKAVWASFNAWDSRHPPAGPYYREYLPLIQPVGGVRSHDRSMSLDWFTPTGGLRGELRPTEIEYIALLIDHAHRQGRIPVFGETRSLGRLWAIKNSFGGLHVFVCRNLWRQWLSYLYYGRRGMNYFRDSTARLINRSEDPFLAGIAGFYLKRAFGFRRCHHNEEAQSRVIDERLGLLLSLPEGHAFAMFMALHIYLYLHAQFSADLAVDVTKLARDGGYRSRIESELARQTGLEISLSDVADEQRPSGVAIGVAAIDWDEIRDHARVAAQTLSAFADPRELMLNAIALIDSTIEEMHRSEAAMATRDDTAEEMWYAGLQEARCHWALGDETGFLRRALALFNERPNRAEPLFDLARFHRERGMHETAAHFAEAGLVLERPGDDAKFVEDFVYQYGFQEELSIAGFYCRDPARKDRSFAACNWLALNRKIPEDTRNLARERLCFYVLPASELMPSFTARTAGFSAPDGWRLTNASVARRGDEILVVQPSVNHALEDGNYQASDGLPVGTRNFLLRLGPALDVEASVEILPPANLPTPANGQMRVLEEPRLFAWRGALCCSAAERDLAQEGWCRQVLVRIDESGAGPYRLVDCRVLEPEGQRRHERHWMPLVERASAEAEGERLRLVHLGDPTRIVDDEAQLVAESTPAIAADAFRSGTQAVEFDGGWLALIREQVAGDTSAAYHHRFIWFNESCALLSVSRPFFFMKNGAEFAAGLAWHPDGKRLIVSYGVDGEAWLATVEAGEVRATLEDVERLPSGIPSRASGNPLGLPSQLLAAATATAALPCGAASSALSTLPIYVINLDRTPARLAEFYKRNAHLRSVERFPAIDGRALDREELIRDEVITADCIYTAGNLGCAMSHFALWRKAVEGGRAITVAEDDAIFSKHFAARSRQFLEGLSEDWDFVQWGWVFQQYVWVHVIPEIAGTTMIFNQDQLRQHIADFQSHDVVPAHVRLRHSFGTVCYSVSPKGARALLQHCTPLSGRLIEFAGFGVTIENKGIDCMMNGAYPSLKAFISLPPLVATEHREDETTVREGGVDRWCFEYQPQAGSDGAQDGEVRAVLEESVRLPSGTSSQGGGNAVTIPDVSVSETEQRAPTSEESAAPDLESFGDHGFVSEHGLRPARDLKSRLDAYPRVLIAILAKQKEQALPLFLRCIEGLDYPKSSIVLYVRTNNNTDRTEQILRDWIARVGPSYVGVEFDAAPVEEPVETFGPHEWNPTRFRVLGDIRNVSLLKVVEHCCDFYFVCDVDNFIKARTLRELVALNLPIVAPMLRVIESKSYYSNFFAKTDPNGYYTYCDQYQWILERWVRGVFEVPLVHCTYLIRGDVISELRYLDGSERYEFVVFSDSARKAGIQQYIDNRQLYGYITFDAESDAAKGIVGDGRYDQITIADAELARAAASSSAEAPATPDDPERPPSRVLTGEDARAEAIKALLAVRAMESRPASIESRGNAVAPRRILIYTQTSWAFGAVHSSLAAHLQAAGWVADIKDWSNQYYFSEFQQEVEQYDYVLTVASGGNATLVHSYGIPPEKIVIVAHDEWDVQQMITAEGIDDFDRYAGYGVISDTLACSSIALGVKRLPFVVRYGVDCSKYRRAPAARLSSVGYGTVMQRHTVSGVERKRGPLAKACAEAAGLRFVPAGNLPLDAMPDFYGSIDSVIMPSLQEGAGLPPLEGAAAGRLVIGTPVGHFSRLAYEGLGILAPLEAGAFQRFTTDTLIYYRDNPTAYVEKCAAIQDAAKQRDWQCTMMDWIELFSNAQ